MILRYALARQRAASMTRWGLRRADARCRRRRERLSTADMVRWAAARDELRDRGVTPPDTDDRPHWWQR